MLNVTMKMFHVGLTSVWEQKLEWTARIWESPPTGVRLGLSRSGLVGTWGRSYRCHRANGIAGGVVPLKLPTSSTGTVIIQPTADEFTSSGVLSREPGHSLNIRLNKFQRRKTLQEEFP